MPRVSLSSLRARLLALLLLSFLPSLAFALHSYVEARRTAIAETEDRLLWLARLAAANEAVAVEEARWLLSTLAELPEVQATDSAGCSRRLANELSLHPLFANLAVLAPNGRAWCSALPLDPGSAFADRPLGHGAQSASRFTSGHGQAEATAGGITLEFASPVLSPTNEGQSIVYAAVAVEGGNSALFTALLPEGAVLAAADRAEIVHARASSSGERPERRTTESPLAEAILRDGEGVVEAPADARGAAHLYAFTPVGGAQDSGMFVILGIPKAEALAGADLALRQHLIGLGLAGALTLVLVSIGAERLVSRHANLLVQGTQRLAEGKLHDRIGSIAVIDELSPLAEALDRMASGLERREAEGREAEAKTRRDAVRVQARAALSQELEEASPALPAMLEAVARHAAESIGDACVIRLWAGDGSTRDHMGYYHPNSDVMSQLHRWSADAGSRVTDELQAQLLRAGKPIPITAVLDADLAGGIGPESRAAMHRLGFDALLIVPLWVQGRAIGSLSLFRLSHGRPYTSDDQALLQDFADRASLALARARLQIDNRRQLETLRALHAGSQALSKTLDMDELAEAVARTCVHDFGVRRAWLGLVESDARVSVRAMFPAEDDAGLGAPRPGDPDLDALIGRAIRGGAPEVSTRPATDQNPVPPSVAGEETPLRACVALPLISRGRSLGAIVAFAQSPDFFSPERVDLLQAYALQAAVALENARLYSECVRLLNHVQALHTVDLAITASLELPVILHVLLEQAATQLGVDAASVLLYNPHTRLLEYAAQRGFRTAALQHTRLRIGEGHAGRAALRGETVCIRDLVEEPGDLSRAPLLEAEGFACYHAVPLIAKGRIRGVLEIFHRSPLTPDPEWTEFLEALSGQGAVAIENAALFHELHHANTELTLAYEATLAGWARALELRDQETRGHAQRVAELAVRLARSLRVPETELDRIRRGALLHDIGKMGIPDSILLKPGPLTEEERAIIRRHPAYAYEMLAPIGYLRPVLDIPYFHHERWDGTGYPLGLKGEQIPLAARIFAVIDVWDALLSDRPYRKAWLRSEVVQHIRELSGSHFDPAVVEAFLRLLAAEMGETVAGVSLPMDEDAAGLAGE